MKKLSNILFLVTLFLLPSYLVRFSLWGYPTNMLDILELVAVVAFAFLLMREEKSVLKQKVADLRWVLIGFFFMLFGTIFSAYTSGGFAPNELGIIKSWIVLPFLFIFLAHLANQPFRAGLKVYVFSASLTAGVGLFLPEAMHMTYDGRLRGWYESPNQLAMYLAPATTLAYFFFRSRSRYQYAFLTAFVFLVAMLVGTQSLGAIGAVLLSLVFGEIWSEFLFHKCCEKKIDFRKENVFFSFFGGIKKRRALLVGVILGSFVLAVGTLFLFQEKLNSFDSRVMIWKSATHILRDHSFFGIGPGNFQEKYLEYQQFYPPYREWAVPHPHNIFLSFWLFSGIFGIIGFLITAGSVFVRFFRHKKPRSKYVVGVFCAFLAILFHGLIDTTIWGNATSVVFWMLVVASSGRDV